MATKKSLDKQHPDFQKQAPKYKLWGDIYEGGGRVEKDKSYLLRHPFETDKQYSIRCQRAAYKNFAAPIVTVFSASIWRKLPDRKLPAPLEELDDDVDRKGTTADQFFLALTRETAAKGLQYVLVDMPPAEGMTTVADDKKAGRRPYFVPLDALDVIDWGLDDSGSLAWAVLVQDVLLHDEPFGQRECQKQYRVWFKDSWQVWAVQKNQQGEDEAVMLAEGVNPLGVVPLVPIYYERVADMVGNSVLDDVASLCLRVYRRDNERDKMLFDCAVPILNLKGYREEEVESFVRSTTNALRTDNAEAAMEYVEPAGASYDAQKSMLDDDIQAIREIALRQVRPESKQRESADAKRMDLAQLNSALFRFSTAMADSEEACWKLAAMWLNGQATGEVEVTYNDDFNEQEISGDLLNAFANLRRNGDISRDTLFDLLKDWNVLPPDFDSKEEAAKLEQEARQNDLNGTVPGSAASLFREAATGQQPGQPPASE